MIFVLSLSTVFADNTKFRNLDKKYKKWLNIVHYIITLQEKKVFYLLKNNRERDLFIKLFWKQRDPTPGTPGNEFKKEHIKRFNYANKYFKYGTTREGWKTDMGKIYIILGPPINKEKIDAFGLYPMEIWNYYGDPTKGLPTNFRIVFFKRYGAGEYKIYDPAIDGPASLLIKSTDTKDINPFDYFTLFEKIREISPEAAEPAISLVSGNIPLNYQPSPFNSILISEIINSAVKNVKTKYARDFINFKGVVQVDYAINYIESRNRIDVFKDFETGINFIHFAISPKRISVDYSEEKDKYYFSYRLTVSISKKDKIIFQYSKTFPFYFNEAEIKGKVSQGFVISDMFPIIPGKFKLTVLIQNSIKKEFSYFDKNIEIKKTSRLLPRIYGPIISYNIKDEKTYTFHSYKIENFNISIDPKNIFSPTDALRLFFCVENHNKKEDLFGIIKVKNKMGYDKYQKKLNFIIRKNRSSSCIVNKIENPGPGSYILDLSFYSKENIPIESKEIYFTISPLSSIVHPTVAYKTLSKGNIFLYYQSLGSEYLKTGDFNKSYIFYSKAYSIRKNYPLLNKEYTDLLLQLKKYKKALDVIENLDTPKTKFDYYFLKGKILFGKKDYQNGLINLLNANKLYDSDYNLINYIGLCYLNLKDYNNALKAFNASLSLNQSQNFIKVLVKKIKSKIR